MTEFFANPTLAAFWDAIVQNRIVIEIALFGLAMFVAGWLTARAIGRVQVRARDTVLRRREMTWRRRNANLRTSARLADESRARDRRRAERQMKDVMRAQ